MANAAFHRSHSGPGLHAFFPPFQWRPHVFRKLTPIRHISLFGLILLVFTAIGCPAGRVSETYLASMATDAAVASGAESAVTSSGAEISQNSIRPAQSQTNDREAVGLKQTVSDTLLANRRNRILSTDVNAAWQVMHGVLAYGKDFRVETAAGPQPAMEYALGGGPLKGFYLRGGDTFEIEGKSVRGVIAELDPGQKIGQGHRDQWVAYMARCGLTDDDVVVTVDGPLTVQGWIRQLEWDLPRNFEGEYSWTLTALLAHRPTTHQWTARDGQKYSIESLLRAEVDQLSAMSACGGSHRLCAIAAAVNRHRKAGLPMTGVWSDAEQLVSLAIEQTRDFQNADGSFSSHYFERPGWSPDLITGLGTTGHAFEFLAVAGTDEMLAEPWVSNAAHYLCRVLNQTSAIDLECGALYHALSGLSIYAERIR